MSGTTFLESNGNLVRTPSNIRDKLPPGFEDIQPRVFNMISAKTEIMQAQHLAAATTYALPMPVHASPLINVMTTKKDTAEWKPKYVPMLLSYAQLGQIRVAINAGLFGKLTPAELVKKAEETCQQEGIEQVNTFYNDIDALCALNNITEQQRLDSFITRLEIFTIACLNRLEKMIHTCIIGESNIPFHMCCTPQVYPTIDALTMEQLPQFWDLFVKYWTTKVDITNIELQKHSNIEPTQWITVEGLDQTPHTVPKENMWKGYLTPKTAQEYFNYFKE